MPRRIPTSPAAVVLGAVLAASGSARAQGNAFLPDAGHATLAVSHTFETYDEFWVGADRVSNPGLGRVETATTSLWLQAGVLEDLAVLANFAYADIRTDGAGGMQDQGFADRTFLLRYRPVHAQRAAWRHSLVLGAGARLPASGYDPDGPVALGDGTNDALLRLTYQAQRDSFRGAYFATELGYDVRGEGAEDAWLLHGEVGATFARLSLGTSVSGVWSDGGTDIGEDGFTFPGLDEDVLRWNGTAYLKISPRYGVAASAFTTFDGRNTGRSRAASTSLVVQL